MNKVYKTERLLLSPLAITDASFIKELVNTPGWIRFIGDRNIKTDEDALAYVEKIINSNDICYWVVKLQSAITAIGVISFIKRSYLPHHDIGFAFMPQHHGNGYAFEAAKTILKDVMIDPAHKLVLATTAKENFISIKLLRKLGFEKTDEIKVDGEHLLVHSISAV